MSLWRPYFALIAIGLRGTSAEALFFAFVWSPADSGRPMACGGHVDLTTITADGASIRIYEELRDLGYSGGYDAVCGATPAAGPGRGGTTSAEAYVPLFFPPGDACRFDWSHETGPLLNGVTVTVKVAHVRLCHSRMMLVRAYPRETQEMVFFGKDRR